MHMLQRYKLTSSIIYCNIAYGVLAAARYDILVVVAVPHNVSVVVAA